MLTSQEGHTRYQVFDLSPRNAAPLFSIQLGSYSPYLAMNCVYASFSLITSRYSVTSLKCGIVAPSDGRVEAMNDTKRSRESGNAGL